MAVDKNRVTLDFSIFYQHRDIHLEVFFNSVYLFLCYLYIDSAFAEFYLLILFSLFYYHNSLFLDVDLVVYFYIVVVVLVAD